MASIRMNQEALWWDDVRDEMTLVAREDIPNYPIPGALPPGAVWYGASGRSVTFTFPVRRAVESAAKGRYSITNPSTNLVETYEVTWNATTQTWSSPVRVP